MEGKLDGVEITKSDMQVYEDVRASGVTNMHDIRAVCSLTDLNKDQVLYIMKNYNKLMKELGVKRK